MNNKIKNTTTAMTIFAAIHLVFNAIEIIACLILIYHVTIKYGGVKEVIDVFSSNDEYAGLSIVFIIIPLIIFPLMIILVLLGYFVIDIVKIRLNIKINRYLDTNNFKKVSDLSIINLVLCIVSLDIISIILGIIRSIEVKKFTGIQVL